MSKTGVPSIMSAPVTTKTGAPFSRYSTLLSFTTESPRGFGRNGDLVANTPTLMFPPSLGGRTVADQFPGFLTFSENSQISQRWENSSIPRMASGLENSGIKIDLRSNDHPSGRSVSEFRILSGNPCGYTPPVGSYGPRSDFLFFLLPYLSPPYQSVFHSVICP